MEIIHFFEILATHSHHKVNLNNLMEGLPTELKKAYLKNDNETLKEFLTNDSYLANESHVVQIKKPLNVRS